MGSLRPSYQKLACVNSKKVGVAKKGRGRPKKNWNSVHKIFKLSEVHDPVFRMLLTNKSNGCEIGPVLLTFPSLRIKREIRNMATPYVDVDT